PAQQLLRRADRERREARRDLARSELVVDGAGLLAEQDREPMRRGRFGRDERRNARLGRGEPRGGAREVELAAAAEIEPHAREIQSLALRFRVRPRDLEPL